MHAIDAREVLHVIGGAAGEADEVEASFAGSPSGEIALCVRGWLRKPNKNGAIVAPPAHSAV